MEMICTCKPLVKRIRSFFVINLDFYFFNDSVFHLGKDNLLPIFKIMGDEEVERRISVKKGGPVSEEKGIMTNQVLRTIVNDLA